MICKRKSQFALLFKCCGKICIECFKRRLIGSEPRILLNSFETENKQTSMCACPIHKQEISIKLLKEILGTNQLEKLSIEALKRQKKKNKDIKYPTVCVDCKKTTNDDNTMINVCGKHKICQFCARYIFK